MTDTLNKAKGIVARLARAGYVAYFAGGWVRDYVMGHPSEDIDIATNATPAQIMDLFPQPPVAIAQPFLSHLEPASTKILATLLDYCILDSYTLPSSFFNPLTQKGKGGLALLDQRAAYRRVHFEQLLKRKSQDIQPLLIPLTLQLAKSEAEALQTFIPLLNEMGFGLREFGEYAYLVDAFPAFIKQEQLQTSLTTMIQDLVDGQTTHPLEKEKRYSLALIACRATLPKSQVLTIEEAQSLFKSLMECENPLQCPMGKPTCLYFSPEEMGKWFQKTSIFKT